MRTNSDDAARDFLAQVLRYIPEADARDILSQPRHEFMTWRNAYLAVHRNSWALPPGLKDEFTQRILTEVAGLPASEADEALNAGGLPAGRLVESPTYLPPPVIE